MAIGSTGVLAGVLLLASAVGLWLKRASARRLAFAAAGATIIVHGAGVLARIIGVPGLLVGVAYPAFVMMWLGVGRSRNLRARPGSPQGRALFG